MRQRLFLFIFFCLITMYKVNFAEDYYPLEVGNVWYYKMESTDGHIEIKPEIAISMDTIEGIEYFRFFDGCSNTETYYYRKDSLGNLCLKHEDYPETVRYKLNAEVGEQFFLM